MREIEQRLKRAIREVPDFPIKGVNFKDISPIFLDPQLVYDSAVSIASYFQGKGITKVLGIESRGFLLGTMIAKELNAGFVLVRKAGKLPPQTQAISYTLEYGNATIEVSKEAIHKGDRILIHDDLLATGGTARAAAELVSILGAEMVGFGFLVNLSFLGGFEKLKQISPEIQALIHFHE